MSAIGSDESWYVLQVNPRAEKFVHDVLTGKGYEALLPLYVPNTRDRRGRAPTARPLFPGYVFCRMSAQVFGPLVTTPRVVGLVGFGGIPCPVDEREIASLRKVHSADAQVEPWEYLKAGDQVELRQGPLAGVRGTLVRFKGKHKLVLSVSLLQRSMAVEIDASWAMADLDAVSASAAGG
ncbi:MAG: hypothetical protein KDC27_05210 [Acidobacteria bacterium]|nr:hypothetical protein [Acidobacteriota bacterium]